MNRVSPVARREQGFTLIELLVATMIFAILSLIVYSGLDTVLQLDSNTRERAGEIADLQRAMAVIERDVLQMAPRPVITELDQTSPALFLAENPAPRLEFTRTGYANPGKKLRSSLKRISYELEDGKLVRKTWSVLDRGPQTLPESEEVLFDDLSSWKVSAWGSEWVESWPVSESPEEGIVELPSAIRMELVSEKHGVIRRLLPGVGG